MTGTCYIIADLHLGEEDDRPLRGFLDTLSQRPPGRLIILGDLFAYWLESPTLVRRHDDVLSDLRALSRNGWTIDLIRGNRELVAGAMLEHHGSLHLHPRGLRLVINGMRIRLLHGDNLCKDPWHRLLTAFLRGFWSRWCLLSMPDILRQGLAMTMRRASRHRHHGHRDQSLGVLDPQRLAAATHNADILVLGHLHAEHHCRIGHSTILVCGAWHDGSGMWLEISDTATVSRHDWPGRLAPWPPRS